MWKHADQQSFHLSEAEYMEQLGAVAGLIRCTSAWEAMAFVLASSICARPPFPDTPILSTLQSGGTASGGHHGNKMLLSSLGVHTHIPICTLISRSLSADAEGAAKCQRVAARGLRARADQGDQTASGAALREKPESWLEAVQSVMFACLVESCQACHDAPIPPTPGACRASAWGEARSPEQSACRSP
jgi:hypothetical protein